MFSKKEIICFLSAGVMTTAGFMLMVVDHTPRGFGVLTLWVAPPLLLAGFLLPVFAIVGLKRPSFRLNRENKGKQLFGLFAFIAALFVYATTLEPTASLWDCSEFIASAYKLQVPHTPGTPLSLLIGRVFAMLSFGDVTNVAVALNFMSALFSALTVFLVYHIIYHLGEQLVSDKRSRDVLLVSASLGGSLCLAFSDTFWFSAVEAETYGLACFFLMLLVWLIISGRNLTGGERAKRLLLIAYLSGLSYCIHPMCLLALPILPFSWRAANRSITFTNTLLLFACGLLIVFLINRIVAIGTFELAFTFDRFFVNNLNLPFYSGVLALVIAMVVLARIALQRWSHLTPCVWALVFLLLGFLPYLLLFIRSNHNPPIDETNPENLALIKAYMNRESYPSSPLFYGPYFDAKVIDVDIKKKIYFKGEDEYKLAGTMPRYVYDSRQTLLPRMYSNEASDIQAYRQWTGLRENEMPTFYHNLKFMFTCQLGHMYFRYLMWNFAGRESDEQDAAWLRPWESLKGALFDNARNQYWMIPLLLGIAGAVFQCRRDTRGFLSVSIFFLITGVILALYLNAPPNAPRERDYIYVGSFIGYCIWIGFGFIAIGSSVLKVRAGAFFQTLACIAVPLWVLYQNFDDHDRSGRTFQVDNARNILRSCAPGAILFTGGDNDTFPLWYVQEVEGFRTDVRVMVLSYMNTDWYINQLRETYHDSKAFMLTLDEDDYRQYGPNDVLYVHESIQGGIDVAQFLALLKREHPGLTMMDRNGEPYHILPSRTLKINQRIAAPVLKTAVGTEARSVDEVTLHIPENYLPKNVLAILDLIVSNEWRRPVYFNFTSLNTLGLDLTSYVIQEGQLYRLQPVKSSEGIPVDTGLCYRNIIEQADYSNLKDEDVHFSYEDHFARIIVPIRQSFNELARAFLSDGNNDMARQVLREAKEKIYPSHLPPSYTNLQAAEILLSIGETELADSLCRDAFEYYFTIVKSDLLAGNEPDEIQAYLVKQAALMLDRCGQPDYLKRVAGLNLH